MFKVTDNDLHIIESHSLYSTTTLLAVVPVDTPGPFIHDAYTASTNILCEICRVWPHETSKCLLGYLLCHLLQTVLFN